MAISNPSNTSYHPGAQFTATSGYGTRANPFNSSKNEYHPGQDYAAQSGTPIPAAASGTVVYSGFNQGGYGNTVVIKSVGSDGGSYFTLYAHQNGNSMPALDSSVIRGEIIGEVGNTGRSSGAHLHFEVLSGNAPVSHHAGGALGFMVSNQSIRLDPNTFTNWGGFYGTAYNGGSGTAGTNIIGAADIASENSDLLLATSINQTGNYSIETIYQPDGINNVIVSGDGAQVQLNDADIALLDNSRATIFGSGNDVYALSGTIFYFVGNENYVELGSSSVVHGSGYSNAILEKGPNADVYLDNQHYDPQPFEKLFSADGHANSVGGLGVILDANAQRNHESPAAPNPTLVSPEPSIELIAQHKSPETAELIWS